ncbi:MAG: LysM peptidoglycan-binding domain-containing protein [Pedobacter sp.]|nr:MAG: LysM peptidoglycan-binding domain-containing protein [Pedobacter sp.]
MIIFPFQLFAQGIVNTPNGASTTVDTSMVPNTSVNLFANYNFELKEKLSALQKTVPLPYNEFVQNYIDIYARQKDKMGKMLGKAQHYFPIFEKALKSLNIPEEIKYLAIIESALDPHAVSRVGATGLWQFMYGTASGYGLQMNNFVDERKDPIQASYAAAAYFKDAYDELGDWLLAIAAYNCGKGNVNRAIDKAGSRDFWEIRPYLPNETRNYVPAYIAALYVLKNSPEYAIQLQTSHLPVETDVIAVNTFVSLTEISEALGEDESLIIALNPSYKKKIVNGTPENPRYLILPKVDVHDYAQLYALLEKDLAVDKQIIIAKTDDVRDLRKMKAATAAKAKSKYVTYKVKSGDTLSGIAAKFKGVSVAAIQKVNGLSKSVIQPGMILKIMTL